MADLLPGRLVLPLSIATTFTVAGEVSARDQAYAFAVAWLAANQPGEGGVVKVPDNALRETLGRTTRQSIDREVDRFVRLGRARFVGYGMPEHGLPAPTLVGVDGDNVHRTKMDGMYSWAVDPGVVEAFRVRPGEPVVLLPRSALEHPRCRWTLPLVLRAMGWISGAVDGRHMVQVGAGMAVVRFDVPELMTMLGTQHLSPSEFKRTVLAPAVAEATKHGGMLVETVDRRTKYRFARSAKFLGFELRVGLIDPDPVDDFEKKLARLRAEHAAAPEKEPRARTQWRRPPVRPRRRVELAPADVTNVRSIGFSSKGRGRRDGAIDNAD